jgi:hypothetical protein
VGYKSIHNRITRVRVGPPVNRNAAGGLPENGDLLRIATEAGDIVANPLDGETLIAEAEVLGNTRGTREAEDIEAVVEGDDNDILGVSEILALVECAVGIADGEAYLK